jgi:hypothetical protein
VAKRLGALRPSQVITGFGPGAIVDLTKDSVMVLGTDNWRPGPVIHDFRLEKLLRVHQFRGPGTGKGQGLPVRSFPKWRVCPKCGALSDEFPRLPDAAVPICDRCKAEAETHPARFVMACEKGHISDFPWVRWAHRGQRICERPQLKLKTKGRTGALSDLEVQCICGASQSLYGALGPKGLSTIIDRCSGYRPWIGDVENECKGTVRGLQRGASNVYFPSICSGLSIPPWVTPLQTKLDAFWPAIQAIAQNSPQLIETIVPSMLPDENPPDVLDAVKLRLARQDTADLRTEEWGTLTSADGGIDGDDFSARTVRVPDPYNHWIKRVVQVRRLREVRVLRGFTRIDPTDPELSDQNRLAALSGSSSNWLPAVEVRGEGIFIELDRDKVQRWERLGSVSDRTRMIIETYTEWRASLGWPTTKQPLPRDILIHTLSHLLIKQLSLDAGYSSASIRERLYSSPNMCGFLLYTAAPGADGSLGGLIQQSDPVRLKVLLDGALEAAGVCSSDPLCREHKPSEHTGVNGAACHACALAPETACEKSNRLLDRASVVDLPGISGTGYFTWLE